MKKLITVLSFALILTGCSQPTSSSKDSGKINACDIECDDEQEDTSIQLDEISMDEAISYFTEKKTGVLYFGFEKCPWCQQAKPIFTEVADMYDIHIQYIKTRDDDRNLLYTDEQKEQFTPYLKDYMSNNDDGILTLFVPVVVYVKDGVVVDGHVGTFEDHDAHEREMTDSEKEELKKIYTDIFKQVEQE